MSDSTTLCSFETCIKCRLKENNRRKEKLNAIKKLLEDKSKALEADIANLEWHGVWGAPLAIPSVQLSLAKKILEIINE